MLYQPIEQTFKPTESKKTAITLDKFLQLLKNEEDYFKGEQHHTKIMITRLRKIFYDIYGWNSQLIRGAAKIEGRYEVKLIESQSAKQRRNHKGFEAKHMYRVVVVKEGDWMNPDAGSVPEIYANNNQTVILPTELYCDLGHVIGGMDAYNHLAPVTPLPNALMLFKRFFPLVNSNMDIVTWLGDIASSAGEFLYKRLEEKRQLTDEEKQKIINSYAPGEDMLGNIDPYVICEVYDTKAEKGLRVTEIFKDYYSETGKGAYYRKRRYQLFCSLIGLKNWDGTKFSNEKKWMRYYLKQLRNNNAFYVFSRSENFIGVVLALITWMRGYKRALDDEQLLEIFLIALKKYINKEPELGSVSKVREI